jgi:hypothetical protein
MITEDHFGCVAGCSCPAGVRGSSRAHCIVPVMLPSTLASGWVWRGVCRQEHSAPFTPRSYLTRRDWLPRSTRKRFWNSSRFESSRRTMRSAASGGLRQNEHRRYRLRRMTMNLCPRCELRQIPSDEHAGKYPGALSRTDDETEVCSACGTDEAMEQWLSTLTPKSAWPVIC